MERPVARGVRRHFTRQLGLMLQTCSGQWRKQNDRQHHRPHVPVLELVGGKQIRPGLALNDAAEREFEAQRKHEPEGSQQEVLPGG